MVVTLVGGAAATQVPSDQPAVTAAELEALLVSPCGDDAASDRGRLGELLVELAAGDRQLLEELRSKLLDQMHGPDRSGVAAQLRIVETALSQIPYPVADRWRWIQRVADRRPRRRR